MDGLALALFGPGELLDSALVLAYQLSDEQYAVPSHPFTLSSQREASRRLRPAAPGSRHTSAKRDHLADPIAA